VSGAIKAYLVETGVPTQRIHVIHNGADCHRFSPDIDGTEIRERFGLGNRVVVGFVGGFLPWHGVETLLDVVANHRSRTERMCFLLVGPASQGVNADSSLFRKMESANNGGSVIFSGPVPHRNVPKYMAAMDIAVMPNSNRYGSPIKIFEYMAMGKSVVAPSLPPIEEIITHGKDGWLVDPTSSEDLWNAIEYLYKHPQIRHQMGIRARETVLRMFTWSQHAERLGLVLDCLRKTTLC
jgi:glycosyltransferase involved in cell wall biosynthesis